MTELGSLRHTTSSIDGCQIYELVHGGTEGASALGVMASRR
eukprot:CAMPEP_0183445070 /NCGR_PEP_ID=MMETSP0370-20130417/96094_1 /TAXON_ID=268820 /ORGANISM="Peridinium aciculiferum, Strain PAER-2" /LENGTH=40 /DNA_ID= /DNA_START= /DNA_END= /DNA_ORIENTATION=